MQSAARCSGPARAGRAGGGGGVGGEQFGQACAQSGARAGAEGEQRVEVFPGCGLGRGRGGTAQQAGFEGGGKIEDFGADGDASTAGGDRAG